MGRAKASQNARKTTTKKRMPTKPSLLKLTLPKRKVAAETRTARRTTKALTPTTMTRRTARRTEKTSQKVRAKASQKVRAKASQKVKARNQLPKRTPPELRMPPRKHQRPKQPPEDPAPEDTPSNLHCE